MDVTPLVRKGQQIIQSYSGGKFKVSGQIYDYSVIVSPEETIKWDAAAFHDLDVSAFRPLFDKADEIDVVLLGCGAEIAFLPEKLRFELKEKGLQIDVMDTGAACRTYNVLMAEGRRVVCALLPA